MVTIQETELKEGILKAIDKARRDSAPVLVSEVLKIDSIINPLSFFAAGSEYAGERFFWKDPSDSLYIIGLGICKQIQSDQDARRFSHIEEEWKRFIDSSITVDRHHIIATGPTAFGGFSFDPLKEKTALWSKFSHSLFHVPQFMLTVVEGQSYLTTNVVCTRHDEPSLYEKIEHKRCELLEKAERNVALQSFQMIERMEVNPEAWKATVEEIVGDLQAGSLKKVVLARELRLRFNQVIQHEKVLQQLLNEQKDCFIFAFESNGDCFIGASPERLVKKQGEYVYSTCLAGSIKRSRDQFEDEKLGDELLSDEKNLVEHQYVVDMIKEAMESLCTEVKIPNEPVLMKMRDIQHLYTPVQGITEDTSHILNFVDKLHPTPALGGLPKMEAVKKIREVEELDRGYYAAPLGWLDYKGNGEFLVSIRSGLLQGKEASIFAGCGVVAESDADTEYQETMIKFKPMLSALGGIPS